MAKKKRRAKRSRRTSKGKGRKKTGHKLSAKNLELARKLGLLRRRPRR